MVLLAFPYIMLDEIASLVCPHHAGLDGSTSYSTTYRSQSFLSLGDRNLIASLMSLMDTEALPLFTGPHPSTLSNKEVPCVS